MSERTDLTRWNRGGLSRFRYVDGNAVEYLEILRQKLVHHFADPETGQCEWLSPAVEVPANEAEPDRETPIQRQERLSLRQERLLETYRQDRRDWAWEITRTFARACHILTEHANAYANEGYLGTATQWDHVRRLVEMLDYHPAPPASASTPLVIEAKPGKSGLVARGFQVKNSPPTGGAKVVFETLEDLFVDAALNELRPKGWDELGALGAPSPDGSDGSVEDFGFSVVAQGPAVNIQGVGPVSAGKLDALVGGSGFMIKDFRDLDPDDTDVDIEPTWLWDWKAKANQILSFAPPGEWSAFEEKLLPEIASTPADVLADLSGNALVDAEALKLCIEIIGICLDEDIYRGTMLKDLIVPPGGGAESGNVLSPWRAKRKPKVAAGDVAMVMDESRNLAEAVTIGSVEQPDGDIYLRPSPVQYGWYQWKKGDTVLHVSPRFKRECWLNGSDVIRTREPHGLAAGAVIGWNSDWKTTETWDYVALEYAEIVEADKRNLRLRFGYALQIPPVDELAELPEDPRALVVIEKVDGDLHLRIFDAAGRKVVDRPQSELFIGRALETLKRELEPWPSVADLSPEARQEIIVNAAACAGHSLLPAEGTALRELTPLDDDMLSAKHEAIVLLDGKGAPQLRGDALAEAIEGVKPEMEKNPFDEIFEINETVAGSSSGGGLLPPASLPKIGSFLFPSPMLPMDLVKAAVELLLSLGVMQIPSSGEIVIKGLPFDGKLGELAGSDSPDMVQLAADLYDFLDSMVTTDEDGEPTEDKLIAWKKSEAEAKSALANQLKKAEGAPSALFQQIIEEIERTGPLLATPAEDPTDPPLVDSSLPRYVVEGNVDKIDSGQWVVGEFSDGLRALKFNTIAELTSDDKAHSLSFEKTDGIEAGLEKIYADFRGALEPEEGATNGEPVPDDEIELEEVPESLEKGQDVVLAAEGKAPVAAKIDSIDGNTIKISPPAPGFTKGELIIHGNVVLAGHGETMPEKILGSGDAARSNQAFVLPVEEISFTPDSTKSAGVAAAIEVEVGGQVWNQVSTLKDSAADDRHYAVRMTEQAHVKIIFGDGQHGRRLPTGRNNLRVRYRVGSGTAGNLPAESLEKPVNKHPLVAAVLQPLPSTGGGDMESVASLRENAPPTVLALERAVSLSDFSHLAAAQSSIWQAKAYREILHGGRLERVKVIIVPAGGVSSDVLEGDVEAMLRMHAPPGVHVTVDAFEARRFDLSVTVRVKTGEFLADEVEQAVISTLKDRFALKNRKLGAHLYLSEIYKVVEGVQGVENSICVLPDAAQVIRAGSDSVVVYLDTDADASPSTLNVIIEEYQP